LKSQFDVYEKKTITHRNGRMKFEHYNWRNCSSWQNPPDYDVSGITCDRDRNLKELKRQMNGNYVDFEYSHAYGTESNRMEWVVEWNNQESIDLTHDRNGNMTSITGSYGIVSAWYDWRNLTLGYSDDDTNFTYRYDHLGNRTYKKSGNVNYVRGAFGEVLAVYNSLNLLYHNILRPDGTVIGRREGSNRLYYHRDHLGSTRAVANASGSVVETQDYYPFGLAELVPKTFGMPGRSMTTGNSAKEKFTSHELDDEVDLYYMVARRYAPEFGRFLSVDPLADEFPGWSSYNYTLYDPVRFVDPDGRNPLIGFAIRFAVKEAVKRFGQRAVATGIAAAPGAAATGLAFQGLLLEELDQQIRAESITVPFGEDGSIEVGIVDSDVPAFQTGLVETVQDKTSQQRLVDDQNQNLNKGKPTGNNGGSGSSNEKVRKILKGLAAAEFFRSIMQAQEKSKFEEVELIDEETGQGFIKKE